MLELALFDTVNLENSLGRGRLLVAVAQAGARLLETGEQEERLAALEAALGPRFAGRLGQAKAGQAVRLCHLRLAVLQGPLPGGWGTGA